MTRIRAAVMALPWRAAFIVAAWFTVNIIFTLYNKWLFSEMLFTFPIFMTVTHMLATSIASASLILFVPSYGFDRIYAKAKRSSGWLAVLMFCYAGNIVMNNASLVFISIVLNQIIRTLLPLATIILSRWIEKKRHRTRIYMAIVGIVAGVGLTVYRNLEFHWVGAICVTSSMCMAALWTVVSARLMNGVKKKATMVDVQQLLIEDDDDELGPWIPIELVFAVSFPSACLLAVGFFTLEYELFVQYDEEDHLHVAVMVAMGCMFAFVYNLLHYAMISVTSSVNSTILGNVKIIILILLSIPLFGIIVQWWNVVGICWTILSMIAYSYFAYHEHAHRQDCYEHMLVATEMATTVMDNEEDSSSHSRQDSQ
jgi:drug/metabolite transporter (DMT)-like permease